ncbi:cytochrome c [Gilvimarinus agarilyticus]|uniref:c-type cytochrome n=1 Tax=unclassified Gilvimarinus TaxID=2642066 RepID=UPI001C094B4D|nr:MULTISPECIES: cytochrome c [unclassified Gilvimarinus]MBU2887344.1 cytochrome c [Gilvimarinus agarilyticus]MDO6572003.1 cytochrome c [Gilvimarinus sp. 2_MG-2023]MDO6746071.1 cytochrome c [Gilvimarinus sp. 1_MG-2023]
MRLIICLTLVWLISACSEQGEASAPELAADPVAMGAKKARACMGCHGPKGVSRIASYPSLAGLDADYIAAQLQAFQSGERQNPMMSSMAINLSEQDIHNLAAYFAAQTPAKVQP